MGGGGGRGGNWYSAASVAMLGDKCIALVESKDRDIEEYESTDDALPLLVSLSVSQFDARLV
jgi:hypothetical protein